MSQQILNILKKRHPNNRAYKTLQRIIRDLVLSTLEVNTLNLSISTIQESITNLNPSIRATILISGSIGITTTRQLVRHIDRKLSNNNWRYLERLLIAGYQGTLGVATLTLFFNILDSLGYAVYPWVTTDIMIIYATVLATSLIQSMQTHAHNIHHTTPIISLYNRVALTVYFELQQSFLLATLGLIMQRAFIENLQQRMEPPIVLGILLLNIVTLLLSNEVLHNYYIWKQKHRDTTYNLTTRTSDIAILVAIGFIIPFITINSNTIARIIGTLLGITAGILPYLPYTITQHNNYLLFCRILRDFLDAGLYIALAATLINGGISNTTAATYYLGIAGAAFVDLLILQPLNTKFKLVALVRTAIAAAGFGRGADKIVAGFLNLQFSTVQTPGWVGPVIAGLSGALGAAGTLVARETQAQPIAAADTAREDRSLQKSNLYNALYGSIVLLYSIMLIVATQISPQNDSKTGLGHFLIQALIAGGLMTHLRMLDHDLRHTSLRNKQDWNIRFWQALGQATAELKNKFKQPTTINRREYIPLA